jgi:hypothetical protein
MNNQSIFILKIIIYSLLLSLLIKYLAPLLTIPATNFNAFVIVMGVPLIIALLLGVRFWQQSSDS